MRCKHTQHKEDAQETTAGRRIIIDNVTTNNEGRSEGHAPDREHHLSGRNPAAVQTANLSSPRRESNVCKWSGGRPSLPCRMGWKMACCLSSQAPLACPLFLSPSDPGASLKGDIVISLWGSIEGEGCPICLLALISWKRGGTAMTEKELAEQSSYPGPSRG